MPPIVIAGTLALAVAVATAGWLLLAPRVGHRKQILANAQQGFAAPDVPNADDSGRSGAAAKARRLATAGTTARLDRQLALAGRPPAWPLRRILLARLVLPCVAAGAGLVVVGLHPPPGRLLLAAGVVVGSHFVPDLLLMSRAKERQTLIALQLPDVLDQMTIAVEAGLGFESAVMRAARNGTGPLAQELVRTLQDMQFGQSRREAYLALAARSTVVDLRRFLRAVIQADAYGIPIADVLRTQAAEMRTKRRQRAEERAMKIPVKVIFPLMLCILPALFIVLLGPAVIDMITAFGG